MNNPPVSCESFLHDLDALLGESLEPERAEALLAHKDSCAMCRKEYEEAMSFLASFSALPPLTPRPHAIENLQRSIEAEQQAASAETLWAWVRAHPVRRFATAMALGLLAALVSTFSFGQVAFSLKGLTQTLLVCGLFWACGYTGMFDIAFRRHVGLQARRGFNLMRIGERVAFPVLIALGVATIGLLATAPFGGLRLIFSPFNGFDASLQPSIPYLGWFGLGTLIGGVSLLLGANIGHTKERRSFLLDGVLAGSLFVLMIAPGFAIICVPFTLGLFLVLSGGLVLGSLAGGVLGFWSSRYWRMRVWGI